MKAAETNLRNLLEGTKQFRVPLFQRPYSWKKEKWLPVETTFKDNNPKEEKYSELITDFFWFYLRKDGKSIPKKEVYQSIKSQIDSSNNNIEDEINTIIRFAQYYQCIIFTNLEEEAILKKYFGYFQKLDFSTCHIFRLNIYNDYDRNILSLEDFKQILLYLESYFIRRWFADIPPNTLGKVFDNLYEEVKKNNPNDLVKGLHTVLSKYSGNKIWPEDDKFRKGIIEKVIYKKNDAPRVKFILERLEESSYQKEKVNTDNLTIEHIMPQSLTSEWKKDLGTNYNDVKRKWLHTLGNLTLTGDNSGLSNKPFEYKKKIYQESKVYLNKYFQNVDIWNEKSIEKRAEYLADIAVKIWLR
ncbi:MAG: DUF1524 domain-containing protein [Xenococcaceae cyanobacterium]